MLIHKLVNSLISSAKCPTFSELLLKHEDLLLLCVLYHFISTTNEFSIGQNKQIEAVTLFAVSVFRKEYPVVFTVFTSDDLSSCVGLALEERQHHGRLVRTVHAGLDRLLEHCVDWSGTKVVRELLHELPVEVRAIVAVLVYIDAHWNDTKRRSA